MLSRRRFLYSSIFMYPATLPPPAGRFGEAKAQISTSSVEVVHTRVFAAQPGGGNPCPVIMDADQLTVGQMQQLANRFGQDTAFVLTPESEATTMRIRYFVPGHEMGVSGHATIAAVTVMLQRTSFNRNQLRIETSTGGFDVGWKVQGGSYEITLEQNAPTFGETGAVESSANALGIHPDDIDVSRSPIQSVSVSRSKLIIPLHRWQALDSIKPNFETLWNLCDSIGVSGLYPFTRDTNKNRAQYEARQFPIRGGLLEDAATGVAAAALGAYVTRYDLRLASGHHVFRIAQGYAMGQPSLIEASTDCSDRQITKAAISGVAQIVGRERVHI
jgi:trans-2,3-dihydro-3-hydroxyanthranilate isomerase